MRKQNPWDAAQEQLRHTLDEHSYKNWFSQTRFESWDNGRLIVGAPSQFFAEWLRDHFKDTVLSCVQSVEPGVSHIQFVVCPDLAQGGQPPAENAPVTRSAGGVIASTAPESINRPEGFNPRYVFDRFVVGSGNRFAHAAAKAVAAAPARAYNPLFLYGETGLGKTHLMQALGQDILMRKPNATVMFISSEQFTNQLIESIAKKSTSRFRSKYRKVDVLLIDDIQFISGKEATQEEFFHTFNALYDNHKQIVISSDRQPKEIQGLEKRLVTRFEMGLVTDIQSPDFETRVAILQSRAAEENLIVPTDVLEYIATHVTSNIRELEGALVTVLAYAKLTERKISFKLTEEVLRDLIGRARLQTVTCEAVQKAAAEHFDLRLADMKSKSRQRQVAFPRQIAMYLCKEVVPNVSLSEIGEAFGGKDHTTVLYACQKISQQVKRGGEISNLVNHLQRMIRDQI